MNHGTSGECQPDAARVFDRHRGLLVSVAYRVLGSVTDAEDEAMDESVSMAMMVVLETLSPLERAVFVLREAFGRPHAEIAEVPRRVTLVFDGHCGVCTRSVRLIKRLDRKRRVTAVPFQMPGVPASAGLTVEACREAAWAVTPEGQRYRGAQAVNLVLAAALGTKLPYAFYRLPLIKPAQDRAYDWIAANRHMLPGDEAHCSQHPGECA